MDLIYTDKNRKDIGVLSDYELDEAFGKSENNFSLKISLSEHCMEPGCVIYAENTEYGGIIDTLNPNTKDSTLTYKGLARHFKFKSVRTGCWRGLSDLIGRSKQCLKGDHYKIKTQ